MELLHVVLFPFPEQGHICPMLQLALHLASRGAAVTFINTERAQEKMQFSFNHHHIRFASISDGLPAQQNTLTTDIVLSGDGELLTSTAMPALLRSLPNQGPALEKLLSDLIENGDRPPVSCLISDAFLPWAGAVVRKLHLSWMVFWSASATRLCLTVHALENEAMGSEQHRLVVNIPGLPPTTSLIAALSPVQSSKRLELLQARVEAMKKADGILLNTFDEVESEAIADLSLKLPIRSLGPLCLDAGAGHGQGSLMRADEDCLTWLDGQAAHSVLYVSFGSKVALQGKPLEQLALGIEASEKPFLWVLRSREEDFLNGFFERTKERSRVVSWAPQKKVLEHIAVGAFLTHCGWNSVVEALVLGVPMVCWPVFADQPTNRVLVEKKWKIGKGFQGEEVHASEIGVVVQEVMGDEDFRHRAALLGQSARSAMKLGGFSHQNLNTLLSDLQHNLAI